MAEFQAGDTVALKSGGPEMTVEKIGTSGGVPTAWCIWFEGDRTVRDFFPVSALERAEDYI